MQEYKQFNIMECNLIDLLHSKILTRVYYKLLTLVQGDDTIGIVYSNYDELAKKLGFKTRSGCWKAIKKLERLDLITSTEGCLWFNHVGVYYD